MQPNGSEKQVRRAEKKAYRAEKREHRSEKYHRVEQKSAVKNGIVRGFFALFLVGVQFWWIYLLITGLQTRVPWLTTALNVAALILMLTIFSRHLNSSYKMFWMIVVIAFPVLGIPFYVVMGRKNTTRTMRREFEKIDAILLPYLTQSEETFKKIEQEDIRSYGAANYLWKTCHYPLYENTDVKFFDDALKGFEDQLVELSKAEHYIFMEYYAIEEEGSFQRLADVLSERVKAGVEVRMIYDDMGSISFINKEFITRMTALGIHCVRFNPLLPFLNIFMNNRDHRKITVIDGKIGYTGGYNLANEYFHVVEPFGHWKDSGVRLTGDAVLTLNETFLEMWNLINRTDPAVDAARFLTDHSYQAEQTGFVQPYADSPLDDEATGEEVYMNLLRSAERYAWFVTPYLIITDEMRREMIGAAKRGVDVRIITPHIPDKKMVFQETRSYYAGLIRGGVRIFEYTPGFAHAKMSVSDDHMATVGTINLDFRSLYLHFEDGVVFYNSPVVPEIREDFEKMFEVSEEVTDQYRKGAQTLLQRAYRTVLRFIAPQL